LIHHFWLEILGSFDSMMTIHRAKTHINTSTVSKGAALWLRLVRASKMALIS
jgi:hypothetical protein